MRFTTISSIQLFVLAILIGLISGGLVVAAQKYQQMLLLPMVTFTPGGECVKVTNFENGHAFSCQDVNVLLRQYRKEYTK